MRIDTCSLSFLLVATVLATGCEAPAPQACRDLLRTMGDVAEDCGDDREAVETAIEESIRDAYGAGCGGADRVRDIDAFYDECIPYLESLGCDEYLSADLPPSCRDQLIYLR